MQAKFEKGYDRTSRLLHWIMAIIFLMIYTTGAVHYFLAKSALDEAIWPTHYQLGVLLFILFFVRCAWAMGNINDRPKALNKMAVAGHVVLYIFMLSVPLVALLRQYGSGRSFAVFGIKIMHSERPIIQQMIDIGNNFHSLLGWLFLMTIIGHILVALVHSLAGNKRVIKRMSLRHGRRL